MPDSTPATVADSQGTTFTLGTQSFIAKNVKVKVSKPTFDTTPLSASAGTSRVYQGGPLSDTEITCEYWGSTVPTVGVRTAITCSLSGISGYAVCESFELTAAVGELIVGNLTLKVSA
jgi:hypothetical protein